MILDSRMTAKQFAANKHLLPEGGRWQELHEGRPVLMQPPDDLHGTTVLNLSRALAWWLQGTEVDAETENADEALPSAQTTPGHCDENRPGNEADPQRTGYACHEIGLQVAAQPDTVYCPAISFFDSGSPFAQSDQVIASIVPRLVIEVASANDRRAEMRTRTLAYMQLGVEMIWVPDPVKKELQVIEKNAPTLALGERQILAGNQTLPEFRMKVSDVFAQPSWWGSGRTQ